jgi:hypothetical protein
MTSRSRPPEEVMRSLPKRLFETYQQRRHELAKVGTYLLDLTARQVLISPEMAYLLGSAQLDADAARCEFRDRVLICRRIANWSRRKRNTHTRLKVKRSWSRACPRRWRSHLARASSSVERNERASRCVGVVQDVTESACHPEAAATEARFRA